MDCNGKLTKETVLSVTHTSKALLQTSDYCINSLNAKYVLLGKFQTDSCELYQHCFMRLFNFYSTVVKNSFTLYHISFALLLLLLLLFHLHLEYE